MNARENIQWLSATWRKIGKAEGRIEALREARAVVERTHCRIGMEESDMLAAIDALIDKEESR